MPESEVITTFIQRPPDDQHTAAYKLWHYTFEWIVAQMHLVDQNVIQQFGVVTTGDKLSDRALAEQPIRVQLSPAAVAEMVEEGIPVRIANPPDAAKIYKIIHQHLKDWEHAARMDMHINRVPRDWLLRFDFLAGEIYPHAKPYLTENPFHGRFFGALDGLMNRRGGMGRLRRTSTPEGQPGSSEPEVQAQDLLPSRHTPMTQAIDEHLAGRRKPWQ